MRRLPLRSPRRRSATPRYSAANSRQPRRTNSSRSARRSAGPSAPSSSAAAWIRSATGAAAQPLAELRDAHPQRRHGIAEIVQHAFGEFGESRVKRLIDELPPRLLDHALDHAVEFARQAADLVAALQVQSGAEIRALADRYRMARHSGERLEDDAIEHDEQTAAPQRRRRPGRPTHRSRRRGRAR